ncbi:pyridoxal phosphate-dependent aminotransferase [Aurantimonas sp. HBX-1]|uniref:pyridoxal phosphate-dependent aminotransferase n=1 Tax=Aurantimonas sp. HBX-1 TaxID=2906072 RepID=UPI001F46CC52|nr:pyridoxal phosphate-dependent aminotransferase [Aurantimonas sp. HBX-1]UIJ73277.1 pyridoxal phosphate-dependent aminotransferase [Aurantimonas sp. HBX-1]
MTYRSLERANAYFYDPERRLSVLKRHGAIRYLSSGVNHLKAPAVLLEIAARELTARRLVENYTAPGGAPALLAAIAFETHERVGGRQVRGAVGLANIAMTAGATGALAAAFRYMAEVAGARSALVLGLNYSYFSAICDECGVVYRTARSAQDGRILPSLEEAADWLARERPDIVVLTQPTNPSGEAYDAAELARLVAMVEQAGAWLVFDEVPELAWPDDPDPPHPFTEGGDGFPARLVWINSFSKSRSLAGLRAGWIIADAAVVAFVRRHNERSLWSPVHPGASALATDMVLRAAARRVRRLPAGPASGPGAIDEAVLATVRQASRYLRLFSPWGDDFAGFGGLWGFLDATLDWPAAFRRYAGELAATAAVCAANRWMFETRLGPALRARIAPRRGFNQCVKFDVDMAEWDFARRAFDAAGLDFYTECVFADHDREDSRDYWVRISTASEADGFADGCERLSGLLGC